MSCYWHLTQKGDCNVRELMREVAQVVASDGLGPGIRKITYDC